MAKRTGRPGGFPEAVILTPGVPSPGFPRIPQTANESPQGGCELPEGKAQPSISLVMLAHTESYFTADYAPELWMPGALIDFISADWPSKKDMVL